MVKHSGRGCNHPLSSSGEIKVRVELELFSTYGSSWRLIGRNLVVLMCRDIFDYEKIDFFT
jgi:hypothetical protein